MKKFVILLLSITCTISMHSQRFNGNNQNNYNNNAWREIGEVRANYGGDHDAINVSGPFDDFRKLKLRVSSADVNMERMLVTFDGGGRDEIPLRFVIEKGQESRVIDLKGGKRSIRRIEFWFDTKGRFSGKARVTVYGRR